MSRKIISFMVCLALVFVLACSDNDPLPVAESGIPVQNKPDKAARLRSISVSGRLEYCLNTSQVADLYYQVNGGGFAYVATITSTSCGVVGSISADTGDLVELVVMETTSGNGASFTFRDDTGCPNDLYPGACGDLTWGGGKQFTVSSSLTSVAVQVGVFYNYPYCGSIITCI